MTISIKVAISIALAVAVAGAVLLAVEIDASSHERHEQFRETTAESLQLLALAVAPSMAASRHDRVQAVLDNVANHPDRFPDIEAIEVVGRDGRVVADLDPRRFNATRDDATTRRDLARRSSHVEPQGPGRLRVVVPVRLAAPLGVIRATVSERRVSAALVRQRRQAAAVGVVSVAALAAALYLVHRRLVGARLARLAHTASQLRRGRMEARAVVDGRDEVAQLGAAFNQMADDLAEYTEHLEQIVADRTTELRHSNEQLAQLAVTDVLTGLYNRRRFEERVRHDLEVARRGERPYALVCIDVDRFKSINDRFGHGGGDCVLKAVARTLRESARAADLVARIGGEEFVIAMPDTTTADAAVAAERVRGEIERARHPDVPGLGDEAVTASFGVASFPEHGANLSELLLAADSALYAAKRGGRNRVVCAGAAARPHAAAGGEAS